MPEIVSSTSAPTRTLWFRWRRAVVVLTALILSALILSVTACSAGITVKSGGEVEPTVLTLALAEGRQVPYAPAVLHFARTVHDRSGGRLVVEIDWGHEGRLRPDAEEALIRTVQSGRADLAHVPTRTFDRVGIGRFRVLQDPMTLDTLEKADAVASDGVADRMLQDLRLDGLVGLDLYVENLRRPVGYRDGLVHLEDFSGRALRAQPSTMSYDTLLALGARPSMSSTYTTTAEGERYDGAESSWFSWEGRHPFPRGARITGDLVLFPKFNVFIANPTAFDGLDSEDREVLALAARDTTTWWVQEHRPSEEALAEAWCAGGRRLVMAGPDGIASVRTALRPVVDDLEADPKILEHLEAVRRIAAENPGSFVPPDVCHPPTGDGVWLDE